MAAAKPGGIDHQPVDEGHHDAADDHEEEQVLKERDRAASGQSVELKPLPQRLDDALRDRREQDHEPPEDEGVEDAREGPSQQPSLRDHVHEEGAHPRRDVIETALPPRRAPHQAEQFAPAQSTGDRRRPGKEHERDRADDRGHGRRH